MLGHEHPNTIKVRTNIETSKKYYNINHNRNLSLWVAMLAWTTCRGEHHDI